MIFQGWVSGSNSNFRGSKPGPFSLFHRVNSWKFSCVIQTRGKKQWIIAMDELLFDLGKEWYGMVLVEILKNNLIDIIKISCIFGVI